MKKNILQMMIMVGMVACSISFAQAQTAGTYRTEIPFDFSVGDKQYVAGVYFVEVRGAERPFFVLRDSNGRNAYAVQTMPASSTRTSTAALDFYRFAGDQYALAAIRMADRRSILPKSRIGSLLAAEVPSRSVTIALSSGK